MRINNFILKLTLFFSILLLVSCSKDWLDAKSSKSLAVPATIKDFQALLDSYGLTNVSSTLSCLEIAADGHYYTEDVWKEFKGTVIQNIYTWSNDVPYTTSGNWSVPYSLILNMNIILNESEKLGSDDPELLHIRAQALFHRSRMFFDLAQAFAVPYNTLTSKTDLGIPLRLTVDITEPSQRSTLYLTYQQVINDLIRAKDNLPITPYSLTRASKPAALALLARVYLTMGDYENALKYSNECLQIRNKLYDYNSISPTANFIGTNIEILFSNVIYPDDPLTSYYLVDSELFGSYSANDLRKQVFFKNNSAGIQFKGSYGYSQTIQFAGIALDEIYLIRAECYARTNNIALAMNDLNELLRNRWRKVNGVTTYVDQTAIDETNALNIILSERRKQLILRNLRWSDLRRLGTDPRFAKSIKRTIGGNTYTLEPNSYRYTFPIPNDIIQKSGIQQNPGWE